MRSSKYNIGGMIFSLLDIEHGILRNSSAKPMIFGPLTVSMSFSERDPRKQYALEQSKPNISFVLFTACNSSPVLSILRDPTTLDDEMKHCAKVHILRFFSINKNTKVVELPQIISIYWEDFGGKRKRVFKYLLKLLMSTNNNEIIDELKTKINANETTTKSDIQFKPHDWTPALIL